jgi:hypothetical protein
MRFALTQEPTHHSQSPTLAHSPLVKLLSPQPHTQTQHNTMEYLLTNERKSSKCSKHPQITCEESAPYFYIDAWVVVNVQKTSKKKIISPPNPPIIYY